MLLSNKLLLTVPEVAYALNCSAGTVYKLIHNGNFGYKKQGRSFLVYREDLERYVSSNLIYGDQVKPN